VRPHGGPTTSGGGPPGSWKIARVAGIPIRLHFSWFIVFALITWSLSTFYFPDAAPDLPAASYWVRGALAALLLFASIALHELGHSLVARRHGVAIESITLFIFGGVAQMKGEPPHPRAELRIALAGPLTSLVLAAAFFAASMSTRGGTQALFSYVGRINLIIALFNLVPGFPMDGGRVLRSLLWARGGNFFRATRTAAGVGRRIAIFFIAFGIFSVFARMPGGLWLMLIGWFLHGAAEASQRQTALQEVLSGFKVKDMMTKDIVALGPSTTVADAVNDYFLRYGYGGLPVVEGGRFLGFVTLKEVKDVPRSRWGAVTLGDILVPHEERWEVSPEDDVVTALESMIRQDKGRLVIVERGELRGLITRNGVARYVQVMGS
jgi:Zn-dependent protease/CBS domain-containing protein